MSKKLYVCKDSPAELKETITVAQRMMDNMAEFKVKADDGSLTFADLDELARRNNAISSEYPTAQQPVPGYPVQTKNMNDLEALSKSRLLEAESELKSQGGAVFEITNFDQLKELSKMPPSAIGQMVIDTAKAKRESKGVKAPKVDAGSVSVPERPFHPSIFVQHLKEIQTLLFHAKTVFRDLPFDWSHAEIFEDQLFINAKSFEDFRDVGVYFLVEVLTGEEDDEDVQKLKGEAAFVLATVDIAEKDELDDLIDSWKADEDLKPQIVQALKYEKKTKIDSTLKSLIFDE
ncbi:MAG: hypothetical protein MJE63_11975, partial [Proteobacteria bacterium]|nr:hypothetical protein [Pseudomonadota bacterium]